MANRSKAYEISITALGVLITAILGYGQYRLGAEQAKANDRQQRAEDRRAVDSIEVQVLNLVGPHLSNLAKPGPEFAGSQRVVIAASDYLTETHGRTGLARMAARISEGNSAVPAEVTARLQEATVTSSPSANWFAVLATLPPDNEADAKRNADEWLVRVSAKKPNGKVALYKTKISNNYAVVLGGAETRETAVELAREARRLSLVADAFAQQDRGWTLIGSAPFQR